jgi:hypothetical protein
MATTKVQRIMTQPIVLDLALPSPFHYISVVFWFLCFYGFFDDILSVMKHSFFLCVFGFFSLDYFFPSGHVKHDKGFGPFA